MNQGSGGREEKKKFLGHTLLIPTDCLAVRRLSGKEEPLINNGIGGGPFN